MGLMQKMIFWDWTGTLADESRLDAAVCRAIEAELAQVYGIPDVRAAERFQAYLKSLENTWEWHDYVRHARHFGLDWLSSQKVHLSKLKLVPYAGEILLHAREKGYKNILATNAVRAVVLLRLEHSGLKTLMDAVVASDDAGGLKAEGRHFACISDLSPEDLPFCFSVGDNPIQDIRPAQELGIRTIFCGFGRDLTHYHSPHLYDNHDISADADFKVQSLRDIESII